MNIEEIVGSSFLSWYLLSPRIFDSNVINEFSTLQVMLCASSMVDELTSFTPAFCLYEVISIYIEFFNTFSCAIKV